MNLNRVTIAGRLTTAPQLRKTSGGQSVISIGVATNRVWTKDGDKKEDVQFHQVVIWGRTAEAVAALLGKGATVLIEGRLQNRSYEDKEGVTRRITEIVAEHLEFAPRSLAAQKDEQEDVPRDLAAEEIVPLLDGDEEDNGKLFENPF